MVLLYGQGEFEGIDDALFRERNKYAYNPTRVDMRLAERGGWGHKWGDPRPLYGNPEDLQEYVYSQYFFHSLNIYSHKLKRMWRPAPGEMYASGDVKPYRGFDSVLKDHKTAYFMQANKIRADAGPQWTNYYDYNKRDYPKAAYHNPPTTEVPSMTYSPGALPPRTYQETQRQQQDVGPGALVPFRGAPQYSSFDDPMSGYGYGFQSDPGFPVWGTAPVAAAGYAPAYAPGFGGLGGFGSLATYPAFM